MRLFRKFKKNVLPIICFALSMVLIVVVFKFVENNVKDRSVKATMDYGSEQEIVYIEGEPYTYKLGTKSLLIVGLDCDGELKSSGTYYNTDQADFITLLVTNNVTKQFTLIHLNRDTMTYVDQLGLDNKKYDSSYEQLALAHTYGDGMEVSFKNTLNAVSNLLYGVKIDNYFGMTTQAIKVFTDYVGGVNVTMDRDYTEIDPSFEKGATVNLNGDQALAFIGSRAGLSDSTNLYRMERQKVFVNSFFRKMTSYSNFNIKGCYNAVAPYILTDYSLDDISSVYNRLINYSNQGIISPEGQAILGKEFMEFYVDDDSLKSIVINNFFEHVNVNEETF